MAARGGGGERDRHGDRQESRHDDQHDDQHHDQHHDQDHDQEYDQEDEARRRFAAARVARLATVRPDGAPHLVPVTFALDGTRIWWAVDDKPKRTRALRRLDNISAEPRVSLLADHFDEEWDTLWWVRADGVASIADPRDAAYGRALLLLAGRYEQYRATPPAGPVVGVDVVRWRWWSALGRLSPPRR